MQAKPVFVLLPFSLKIPNKAGIPAIFEGKKIQQFLSLFANMLIIPKPKPPKRQNTPFFRCRQELRGIKVHITRLWGL